MATPLQRVERRRDLEQLQDDGLVVAQHGAAGDAEQEAVADLAGGPGDSDTDGGLHGATSSWGTISARNRRSTDGPNLAEPVPAPTANRAAHGQAAWVLPNQLSNIVE